MRGRGLVDPKTKAHLVENYGGRPLLPEVWLQKAIELFGTDIPIVLFTPYGLRLNQTQQSRRWSKFVDGTYPEICSIISLPKDVFDGILRVSLYPSPMHLVDWQRFSGIVAGYA